MTQLAVIAGYVRTPFHFARKGALARIRAEDLGAHTIRALVERTGIDPETLEDVLCGCAFPEGEQGFNMARIIGQLAGLPQGVAGATVNRFCGSSMQTIHSAVGAIATGCGDAYIAMGVESMTRVQIGGFNPMPHPDMVNWDPNPYISMGMTAENVADRWKISREEQEAFAVLSHAKAAAAQSEGRLSDEIAPITDPAGNVINDDGCIRPGTDAEGLAGLKTVFKQDGSVTAGTSSPLTDGAAATLVCSDAYAEKHGLEPLARIKSMSVAGCAADIMGIGPVGATKKALKRAGLSIEDIDIVELNEAFASQGLASIRDTGMDIDKVNIDGGALALGHPLGATGARITGKAAALLKREGKKYALSTQCIGGGQGIATILEAV